MLARKSLAAIVAGACFALLGAQALVLTRRDELVLTDQVLAPGEANWEWEDCGSSQNVVQIRSLEISPEPHPGSKVVVTVKASVSQIIEEGAYADVTIKLGLIKLLQKRFDVCEEARGANATIQCPVEPGDQMLTQEVKLPKEIPPAKFTVNVRGYMVDDEDMICANIKADFTPKPPYFPMD